jgi:phenylalanyl-tRNA synthetase beta chain
MKRNEPALKSILLRYQIINETLGPILKPNKTDFDYISKELINSYLERLNFKFVYDKEKSIWQVEIPHLRSDDITREIDIIEEIGRLHGFNNFLTTLPKVKKLHIVY